MKKTKHYEPITQTKKNRFIFTKIKMVALPGESTFRVSECFLGKPNDLHLISGTQRGRKELTSGSCPLTPTSMLWHKCAHTA